MKEGVKLFGIRPELTLAINIAHLVYQKYQHDLIVTSIVDSVHSYSSLHYSGCAFDLRIRQLPESVINPIILELRKCLTNEYDVVLESDHIHVEFQPKRE